MGLLNMPTIERHDVDFLSAEGRRAAKRRFRRAVEDMFLTPKLGRPAAPEEGIDEATEKSHRQHEWEVRQSRIAEYRRRAEANEPLFGGGAVPFAVV